MKCVEVVITPGVSGTAEPVSKVGDKAIAKMRDGTIREVLTGEV